MTGCSGYSELMKPLRSCVVWIAWIWRLTALPGMVTVLVASTNCIAQTLSPPADLRAVVNGNDVELSWSAVAAAEGYKLYYGKQSGSYLPAGNLGSVTSRTFADLPVGSYFVTLSAVKGTQESARAPELAVQIQSALAKPENFSVVPAGNDAQLSWGAVRGADSYTLWYGTTSGSYTGSLALGNVTAKAFTSMPNGKFYLRVGARAGGSSGPLSDEIAVQFPVVNASIGITVLSDAALAPFGLLSITGSGFSPATAALSVLFTRKSDGSTVSVPAVFANATRVDVVVPPLLDAARNFASGEVSVSVVQDNGKQQQLSNALEGLTLLPLPAPDAVMPTGLYSKIVIAAGIDSLESARTHAILAADGTAYLAQIDKAAAVLQTMNSAIAAVMSTGTTLQIMTRSGTTVPFGRGDLGYLDQLLFAWLAALEQALATGGGTSLQALQVEAGVPAWQGQAVFSTGSNCSNAGQDPSVPLPLLQQPCEVQQDYANRARQVALDMPKYAKVAYGGILTMSTGAISGGISAITGAGLAMRVGIGVVTSWAVELAGGAAPTLQGSAESALTGYADELLGVPVFGALQPFVDLWRIKGSIKRVTVTTGSEPAAGIVVNKVTSSPGTGKVALTLLKPTGTVLASVDKIVTVPTVPDQNSETPSLTISSATCTVGERFSFGTIIYDLITISGQTSGPVGTSVWPVGSPETATCPAWTDCIRRSGQPASTSFTFTATAVVATPQYYTISSGFLEKTVQLNCPIE